MATKFRNTTNADIVVRGQTISANAEYTLASGEFDNFYSSAVSSIASGAIVVNVEGVDVSSSQLHIEGVIKKAITFGASLTASYAAENVLLGITQAGMTGTVRARMGAVLSALQTGSLYDVITEAKAIPAEHKDATFITDARLLSFVNKVEAYLGIQLSNSL